MHQNSLHTAEQSEANDRRRIKVCQANRTDLKNNTRLLQQVCSHVGTNDVVTSAEANLNVLSEATAVIISSCFRIPNSLENGESSVVSII